MEESANYLFVYGTLLQSENEFGAYLAANSTFFSPGKFRGRLYDIGEYPGVIAAPCGNEFVYGGIYEITSPGAVLAVLDDYEGFGPDDAQPNLFVRQLLPVETDNQQINCWVYLYNLPIDGYRHIISGNYLGYQQSKAHANQ